MDKTTNQELFKQALVEGVNRRLDREIATYDEDITYSRKHIKNMTRIVNGKTPRKPLSTKMIAILVAAAILLLAGCAIIYRNEIREFVINIKEFFVEIKFDEGENYSQTIDEIYELAYVPEGYSLEKQVINRMGVEYLFVNADDDYIKFIQQPLDVSSFSADSEQNSSGVINVGQYEIYYRQTNQGFYYIWNDGKYALSLDSAEQLSNEILELIIVGIKIK